MAPQPRIDIHAHVVPPNWRRDCQLYQNTKPNGATRDPVWSPEHHVEFMDRNNIRRSVISISAPGTHLVFRNDTLGAAISRDANEDMSYLCKSNPERLSFFASLPLPAVEESLAEIDHALGLGAVGFALMTNIHGTYLGDPAMNKVFDRLNELKAIVFIHPTNCHHVPIDGSTPQIIAPLALPGGVLEYVFDTTRAIANLILTGTVARCPDIKFVIPHCGAALASLLERIAGFSTQILNNSNAMSGEELKAVFARQFYFDLAGFPLPDQLPAMLRVIGPDRLLYGTDFPYLNADMCTKLRETMDVALEAMFNKVVVHNILTGNAEAILKLK